MRQNPCFIQITLNNTLYLLPTGQAISDLKKGIRINETGAFLWKLLSQERSLPELLALSAQHFEIPPQDYEAFRQNILAFLDTLNLHGMLLVPQPLPQDKAGYCHTLSIAGLTVNLFGPADAFSPEFSAFYSEYTNHPHQTMVILYGRPAAAENGNVLIRNRELTVLENADKYILLFHAVSLVYELHLAKDASLAVFYCIPASDTLQDDLFHAMRLAFLYLAQKHDILAIHSASILYRDKAWLFSAPSGTGKSTHAALWHAIRNTPYINGDLNLIAYQDNTPLVYGLPWCGTSGIYDTKSYPLGGVIFLRQAPEDSVKSLSEDERILALSARIISPCFDAEMLRRRIRITENLSHAVFLSRLCCTKNPSAQSAIQTAIDAYLDENSN